MKEPISWNIPQDILCTYQLLVEPRQNELDAPCIGTWDAHGQYHRYDYTAINVHCHALGFALDHFLRWGLPISGKRTKAIASAEEQESRQVVPSAIAADRMRPRVLISVEHAAPEMFILQQACSAFNLVSVSVPKMSVADMHRIMAEVRPSIVVGTQEFIESQFAGVADAKAQYGVQSVVIVQPNKWPHPFRPLSKDERPQVSLQGVNVVYWHDIFHLSVEQYSSFMTRRAASMARDDIAMIAYTHHNLRPVVLRHGDLLNQIDSFLQAMQAMEAPMGGERGGRKLKYYCCNALCGTFENVLALSVLAMGGEVAFATAYQNGLQMPQVDQVKSADYKHFLRQLSEFRPSIGLFNRYMLDSLYVDTHLRVSGSNLIKRIIQARAIRKNMTSLAKSGKATAKLGVQSGLLGGKMRLLFVTDSLERELLHFLSATIPKLNVVQVYTTTETGPLSCTHYGERLHNNNVGLALPGCEIHLISDAHQGLFISSAPVGEGSTGHKDEGHHPVAPGAPVEAEQCGVIAVKSRGMCAGYLIPASRSGRRQQKMNKTSDGFWKSGDVGRYIQTDIEQSFLEYICKEDEIFKMQNHHFQIRPYLEHIYSAHPNCTHVYVLPDHKHQYLAGVFVTSRENLTALDQGQVLSELQQFAQETQLTPEQTVQAIIMVAAPSDEGHCLSWQSVVTLYRPQIEVMFKKIAQQPAVAVPVSDDA